MSAYTDCRDAISAAIKAGDPTCPVSNVHSYMRHPQDRSYKGIHSLFGHDYSDGTKRFHGWMFSRISSPQQEVTGWSSDDTLVNEFEDWRLYGFYSINDTDSESTFQQICDTVKSELRGNASILALESNYDIVVEQVSMTGFSDSFIVDNYLVHLVEIVVRLRLSNQVH